MHAINRQRENGGHPSAQVFAFPFPGSGDDIVCGLAFRELRDRSSVLVSQKTTARECGSVETGQGKRARFLTSCSDFSVVSTGGHRKRSPAFSSQRLIPVSVDHHTYFRPTKERANPVARVGVLALSLTEKSRERNKATDENARSLVFEGDSEPWFER